MLNIREVLISLKSNDQEEILYSENDVIDFLSANDASDELANVLYANFISLLMHTHYKIRSNASLIILKLLQKNAQSLERIESALPNIAASLYSVNKQIAESSFESLKIILQNTSNRYYWPIVKVIIIDGKSKTVRLNVLSLLTEFSNDIPLSPIVKLLDDPQAQVRKTALEILKSVDDKKRVAKAFQKVRLSFEATKLMKQNFDVSMSLTTLMDPMDKIDEMQYSTSRNSSINESRMSSVLPRRTSKVSKTPTKTKQGSSQQSYTEIFSRSLISKREKEELAKEDSQQKTEAYDTESFSSISHIEQTPKKETPEKEITPLVSEEYEYEYDLSSTSLSSEDYQSSRSSSPPANQAPSISHISSPITDDNSSLSSQMHIASPIAKSKELIEESTPLKSASSRSSSTSKNEKNSSVFMVSEVTEFQEKPIGKIILPKKRKIVLKEKNLRGATFQERITYLQAIEEAIKQPIDTNVQPPLTILDAVINATYPFNKRVIKNVSGLLEQLIVRYPEVLHEKLQEVVNVLIESGGIPEADKLFQTLLVEADTDAFFSCSLSACDESKKPLKCENVLHRILVEAEGIPKLSYNTICRTLTRCLSHINDRDSYAVVSILSLNYTNDVQRYGTHQTIETKKVLAPFVNKALKVHRQEERKREKEESKRKCVELIDTADLMEIVTREMKAGENCNFVLLSKALCKVEILKANQLSKLFELFLKFIGTLSEQTVQFYNEEISTICVTKFVQPFLFDYVMNEKILPNIVRGLSACIWECPESLLEEADNYYPVLYKQFKQANGELRTKIVRIFMAIEKVTGTSVDSIAEINQTHASIISEMMSQFVIKDAD